MLEQIFKAVLITSFVGGCLALILTLFKPLTKRIFSSNWHYYMWLVVLLIMMLPVRFNQYNGILLKTPVMHNEGDKSYECEQKSDNVQNNVDTQPHFAESKIKQSSYINYINKFSFMSNNKIYILSIIWLTCTIGLILTYIIRYSIFIKKLHKNSITIYCPEIALFTNRNIVVRKVNDLCSPLLTGIYKPTLLLPNKELSTEQLKNILSHEITHYKRKDILYKWFTIIAKCVHWFNPLIYFISNQINIDCEISCDLLAVAHMNKSEKISYVNTILSLLSDSRLNTVPMTTCMGGNKKLLKRRFNMIKNKKTTGKIMLIVSALVAIIILSTAVYASGILQNKANNNGEKNKIEVTKKGGKGVTESKESSDINQDNNTKTDSVANKYNYDENIVVTYKGEKLYLNYKPFIKDSVIYVQLDEILCRCGISNMGVPYHSVNNSKMTKEELDQITDTYIISYGKEPTSKGVNDYDLTIQDNMYTVNGKDGVLKNDCMIVDHALYVPYELLTSLKSDKCFSELEDVKCFINK